MDLISRDMVILSVWKFAQALGGTRSSVTYLGLPFCLCSWRICAQAIHIEVARSEIGVDITETACLRSATSYNRVCYIEICATVHFVLTSVGLGYQEKYDAFLRCEICNLNVLVFLIFESQSWQSIPDVNQRQLFVCCCIIALLVLLFFVFFA